MRSNISIIFLIILLAVTPYTVFAYSPEGNIEEAPFGPLHVDGEFLYNDWNQRVTLRGFHIHGFVEDYPGGWFYDETGNYFNVFNEAVARRNFQVMRRWGCNFIDLYMYWDFWFDVNLSSSDVHDAWGTPFREGIKEFVRVANEEGLYVMVTFTHRDRERHRDVPWNDPDVGGWENWIAGWRSFVTELKDYPNIIFQPWNEPIPFAWEDYGSDMATNPLYNAFMDGLNVTIIETRKLTDHVIAINLGWGAGYLEYADGRVAWTHPFFPHWMHDPRIQGTNILYDIHVYEAGIGMRDEVPFTEYDDVLQAFRSQGVVDSGKPVVISEWSVWVRPDLQGPYTDADYQRFETVFQIFNDFDVHYGILHWYPNRPLQHSPWRTTACNASYPCTYGDAFVDFDNEVSITRAGQIYRHYLQAYTGPPVKDNMPIASAGGPYTGIEGLAIFFNGSGSHDPEGPLINYAWDFGDGVNGTGAHPIHHYLQEGVYEVTLTVTDEAGQTSEATSTATIDDTAPSVEFSGAPLEGITPVRVNFTDYSTSYDGIVAWQWDFGDGASSAEQHPAHIYEVEGVYPVTLTVYEEDGDNTTRTMESYLTIRGLPDLVLTQLSLNPTTPKTGDVVTFTYTIANWGDVSSDAFTTGLYLNDAKVTTSPLTSLSAGESQTLSFTQQWNATVGTFVFTVISDEYNEIEERNETNNMLVQTVVIPDTTPPSLSLSVSPDTLTPREALNFTITIHDEGGDGVNLRIFVDNALVTSLWTQADSYTYIGEAYPQGQHTYYIEAVDVAGNIGRYPLTDPGTFQVLLPFQWNWVITFFICVNLLIYNLPVNVWIRFRR